MTTERDDQLHALGAFIRAQRQLANLSLRQMADLAQVSNEDPESHVPPVLTRTWTHTGAFVDQLPSPKSVVESSFGFAEELLVTQKDFALKVVDAITPAKKATA